MIYLDNRMRRLAPSAGSLQSWTVFLFALDPSLCACNAGGAVPYIFMDRTPRRARILLRTGSHLPPVLCAALHDAFACSSSLFLCM